MTYTLIGPVGENTCIACAELIDKEFPTYEIALKALGHLADIHLEDEDLGPCRCSIQPMKNDKKETPILDYINSDINKKLVKKYGTKAESDKRDKMRGEKR